MMNRTALWKPIPGYPDYKISTAGQVMRVTPAKGTRPGKVLKPKLYGDGYSLVGLQGKDLLIHRLVLLAFVGAPPTPKHVAAHADHNRSNNSLYNLHWSTQLENVRDAINRGTFYPSTEAGRRDAREKMMLYHLKRRMKHGVDKTTDE